MGHIAVEGGRIGLVEEFGKDMRAAEPRHRGIDVVDRLGEDFVEDNFAVEEDKFVADTASPHLRPAVCFL